MFRRTQDPLWMESHFNYRAVTVFGGPCPGYFIYNFALLSAPYRVSYNPKKLKLLGLGALSVSLAATQEIDFSFSSYRYLDVSVPWVCLPHAMYSRKDTIRLKIVGSPFGNHGSTLTYSSPKHIGVSPVLLWLLVPRHPPCALLS